MKTYAYNSHYVKEGINWLSLIACVGGTLLLLFATMLFGLTYSGYYNISAPALTPNIITFKIFHLTVFALYGYSLHRLIVAPSTTLLTVRYKKVSASMWILGLILATTWLLLYFTFNFYLLSFIWSTLLTSVIITMMILNLRTDKLAALALAPSALWLAFTIYLSLFTALMN